MELGEEVLQDKIELAALHFKSKNYTKSLSLYNEIEATLSSHSDGDLVKIRKHYHLSPKPLIGLLVHPKLPGVLDSRAATYEKLGQFDQALKDAEKILRMDPANCKGYLRTGKLLLKQEKVVDAYKCYQRGIYFIEKAIEKHKLDVSDKLLTQLKNQYMRVNRHLKSELRPQSLKTSNSATSPERVTSRSSTPAKEVAKASSFTANSLQRRLDDMLPLKRSKSTISVQVSKRLRVGKDIIYRLPREVVEWIFSLLPTRALLRCHLVCQHWYQTLTSMPRLYQNIFTLKHRITAPEYFQGLRLLKKVLKFLYAKSLNLVKLWSTFNGTHFGRILENIITDKTLRLKRLDLTNQDLCYEFLLQKLDKCKWNYDALATVEHVRLGFNSSISNIQIFFKLFPRLLTFEIVIIGQVLRGNHKFLLPLDSTKAEMFVAEASQIESHNTLESFVFVNHTGLTRENQKVRPSERTYSVTPKFLDIKFSHLKKLTVVNFDFKNFEVQFGKALALNVHLKELYLENNEELSLKQFLTVIRLYEPAFKIERLTVREKPRNHSYNMVELDVEGLSCLYNLHHLDVYGSSLTNKGLLKLLSVANYSSNLKSLNVGNSNFIYFKKDKFVTGHEVLNFDQLFELAPGLRSLHLNELDLDNLSLKFLHQDLVKVTGYAECPLKKLDLSFCYQIDGIGLMNLVNASFSQQSGVSSLQFDELILDGLNLKKETLALLNKLQLVRSVRNDANKTKWREYGSNSLIQDVAQS